MTTSYLPHVFQLALQKNPGLNVALFRPLIESYWHEAIGRPGFTLDHFVEEMLAIYGTLATTGTYHLWSGRLDPMVLLPGPPHDRPKRHRRRGGRRERERRERAAARKW
jgi:hypothetical protein